jgi:hypothetical protein
MAGRQRDAGRLIGQSGAAAVRPPRRPAPENIQARVRTSTKYGGYSAESADPPDYL